MTEAYSDTLELLMKYYGRSENGQIVEYGAQIPFNFNLIESSIWTPATEFERLIKEFVDRLPKGEKIHANWVVSKIFFIHFFPDIFHFSRSNSQKNIHNFIF